MSNSLIHNLTATETISNIDYFAVDIYNPNDGLYYTYKLSYSTLSNLLSSAILASVNPQLNTLQTSINNANAAIQNKVNRSGGDAMNGNYSISGNLSTSGAIEAFGTVNLHDQQLINLSHPPISAHDAVTKQYVDELDASTRLLIPDISGKLNISGGAMSGRLSAYADPLNDNEFANKHYVDLKSANMSNYLPLSGGALTGVLSLGGNRITNVSTPSQGTDAVNLNYITALGVNNKYSQSGGAIDGSIDLQGSYYVLNSPASNGTWSNYGANTLVPKAYVDAKFGSFLPLAGGNLTGDVTIDAGKYITVNTPTSNFHAATKKYIDDLLTGANAKYPLTGGVINGNIDLGTSRFVNNAPASVSNWSNYSAQDLVPKQYVLDKVNGFLPTTGGTITGDVTLNTSGKYLTLLDPSSNQHAATKNYVDTATVNPNYLKIAGGTLTGHLGVKSFTEDVVSSTASSGSSRVALDLGAANIFVVTLNSGGSTVTGIDLTWPTGSPRAGNSFTLYIKQPASGTIGTFALTSIKVGGVLKTVKWAPGQNPSVTANLGSTDIFAFTTPDSGETWYGFIANQAF